MMNLSLTNLILFFILTWGTNISLNLLYVIKKFWPVISRLDKPIDFKRRFIDGKRFIGDSTTSLGLIVATTCSVVFLLSGLFNPSVAILTPFLVYLGHTIGSFIKRRMGLDKEFLPFVDHGDYVFVSGLVLVISGHISVGLALCTLLLTYCLHPLVALLAFRLGLKDQSY